MHILSSTKTISLFNFIISSNYIFLSISMFMSIYPYLYPYPCPFRDNNKKVMKTTEYIDSALLEIQNYVTDETFLPTRYDVTFPKHFFRTVRKIFHMMFHILMHMYQYHVDDMETTDADLLCAANTLLLHFTCFQLQYHLIESICIDTLEELTKRLGL